MGKLTGIRIESWESLLQHVFARLAHDVAGRMTALAAIGYITRGSNGREELEQVLVMERGRLDGMLNALRSFPGAGGATGAHDLNALLAPVTGLVRWLRLASDVELDPAPSGTAVRTAPGPLQRAVLLALACAAREESVLSIAVVRNDGETVITIEECELTGQTLSEIEEWATKASCTVRRTETGVALALKPS